MLKKLRLLIFIFTLIVLFNSACSKDADILATYKGGKITRGEFHAWFLERSPRANKKQLFKNKSKREIESRLKGMAFQKILIMEAKNGGFMDKARIKKFINLIADHILAQEYIKNEIIENSEEEFEIARAKHIFLRIKNFKIENKKNVKLSAEELEKSKNARIKDAERIIKEIKAGAKIEDLAKKYSEDNTRNKKGDAGYLVKGLMPDEYINTLYSLEEGKLAEKPVITIRGIYILQLDEKKKIKVSEIDDEIEDKTQVNKISSKMKSKIATDFIASLKKASDVKYNSQNAEKEEGADLVFMVGSDKYTINDLNDLIKIIIGDRGKMQKALSPSKRKQLAAKIFENMLIKRKALADGFDKNKAYLKKKKSVTEMIVVREYRKSISDVDVSIAEKMIKDEYTKNKKRYVKSVKKGKKIIKKPLSYKEAKERIKKTLVSQEKSKSARKWKFDLEKKYQIKIDKSKIEGTDIKQGKGKRGKKRKIK